MAYDNARLLDEIERGSEGGPNFYTTIIPSPSGNETRNQNWEDERATWDISYGIRKSTHLDAVKIHYYGRRAALHSFPFRDWDDYKSGPNNTDVQVFQALGDGSTLVYDLVKPYLDPIRPFYRRIYKPDLTYGVIIQVEGVTVPHTDLMHGQFELEPGDLPGDGDEITAAFRFDVPVRYGDDKLLQKLQYVNVKSLPSIKIVGVRPPNY
jgi:uncharacterized protein (TIGR02217 family)